MVVGGGSMPSGSRQFDISHAILSRFFEIDRVWGATAKKLEEVCFGPVVTHRITRTI